MVKRLSGILLGFYVLSIIHPGELVKIPVLYRHYYTHKAENPEINLWQFAVIHYLEGNLKGKDFDPEDESLPFKKIHNCVNNIYYFFQHINNPLNQPKIFASGSASIIPRNVDPFSFLYHNTIWQPPQVKCC